MAGPRTPEAIHVERSECKVFRSTPGNCSSSATCGLIFLVQHQNRVFFFSIHTGTLQRHTTKSHRYPPALKMFSSPKEVQVALLSTDTSCLKRMPSIGPAAVGPWSELATNPAPLELSLEVNLGWFTEVCKRRRTSDDTVVFQIVILHRRSFPGL